MKSMTGYAKSSYTADSGKITVELTSVNRKYCEIFVNTPRFLTYLEDKIRKQVLSTIHRGRINVVVTLDSKAKSSTQTLVPNYEYADAYISALKAVKEKYDIKGEIDINMFAGNRDLVVNEDVEPDKESFQEPVMQALNDALVVLDCQREKEGSNLCDDILMRLRVIENEIESIQSLAPQTLDAHRERLLERIKDMNLNIEVDDERIAKEIALFADRIDISEEIVRLKSHIENFRDTVNKQNNIGKLLDFVIQEMFRETNTIGSKCNNASISHAVIRVKHELEKIREQVYNIE